MDASWSCRRAGRLHGGPPAPLMAECKPCDALENRNEGEGPCLTVIGTQLDILNPVCTMAVRDLAFGVFLKIQTRASARGSGCVTVMGVGQELGSRDEEAYDL